LQNEGLKTITVTAVIIFLILVGYGVYQIIIPTSQYDVIIRYTERYTEQIYERTPSQGYTFLIVTLDIENKIDRKFTADPMYFKVIVNNVEYNYASATLSLNNSLKSFVDLHKNGRISGSVAFEVPEGTSAYTLVYKGLGDWKINWIHY